MCRLVENQYKLDITKDKLKKLGFRYNKAAEAYIYTFCVYKYKNIIPMIYCKIIINDDEDTIKLVICDDNERLYAPYYDKEYGRKEAIIKEIETAVSAELNRLGITKVK